MNITDLKNQTEKLKQSCKKINYSKGITFTLLNEVKPFLILINPFLRKIQKYSYN